MSTSAEESNDLKMLNPIAQSVFSNCSLEKLLKAHKVSMNDVEERVAFYTGLPTSCIREQFINKKRLPFLSLNHRLIILKFLLTCYETKDEISAKDVFKAIETYISVDDFDTFLLRLDHAGFIYMKNRLVENPEVTFQRNLCLSKIKKYRNQLNFLYVSIRQLSKNLSLEKLTQPFDKMKPIENAFICIVSKKGYHKGIFLSNKDVDFIQKWIIDYFATIIKCKSLIIIEDHPIFTNKTIKQVTNLSTKSELQTWLNHYSIPYSDDIRKAEMYELVKKSTLENEKDRFDECLDAFDQQVIRMPEHLEELMLSTHMWAHLAKLDNVDGKSFNLSYCISNINQPPELAVLNQIQSIREEKWLKFNSVVEDYEKSLTDIDILIEEALEKYVLK